MRTLFLRLVTMLVLALAGSMLAYPAMAQSTRVFSNTSSAAITVNTPCTTPIIRTFTVTSNFLIGDVDLGVLASHTWRSDIRVTLQSPAGTRQQLVDSNPDLFFGQNFNVRLNDGGTQIINTEASPIDHSTGPAPPYQHNFIPNAPLSAFNGHQSAGVWQLEICDTFPGADDGTFLRSDLYLTPATSSSGTGATFVVANTDDSGLRSLRQAVLDANATPAEADTIAFSIPGAGPHTITLSAPLPAFLGAGDTIDGTTQPGASCGDLWAGTPPNLLIHLTAGSIGTGLHLEAANLTVRGLAITGFTNKVYLHPFAINVNIRCNYIGLLPDGTRGSGNTPGLVVEGAGTVIGGLNPGDGNVMSGNNFAVWTLNGSTNTAVRGNFIGTNPTGMSAISNERGINHVNGSGSWRDITRNLIAGNTFGEISLDGDDTVTASNGLIRIQRNVLGYNRTLTAKLQAGSTSAIRFEPGSISNVLIGGDTTQGNVIGALQSGIEIRNGANITIQGNTIAGSGANGIRLTNVNGATIGGTAAGLGNIIGGNGGMGILLESGSNNITVVGNTIGTATVAGTTSNNTIHGIRMANVSNISIGNGTAGGRNIISGNGARAIMGSGTTSGITINGNYIGTDATGNAAVANGWNESATVRDAISFDQGGTFSNIAVLNNVIGGYGAALVEIWSSTATGITIQGNSLGVGANGVSPIVSGNIEELI
ncbi:MAG: proprotein convertase P-domain-containing protein, partial [Erythrobacter sp.]|nr:proprotein convertase P-domain-containing protein [Erythrobacter sp.]